jgi:hypothetical protein
VKPIIVTFVAAALFAAATSLLGASVARSENFSITVPGVHREGPREEWRDREQERRREKERKREEERRREEERHRHHDEYRR